ncbi:MAG: hypothetical protein LBO71_08165 [Prevotellaceae bacterium]|nr:hypothetical protein [Prevotellaceae bacterium]
MKTLDLNAYGVYEMNAKEIKKSDGGCCVAGWVDWISSGIWLRLPSAGELPSKSIIYA